MSHQLRVFTYLPNPRIWKATIAARLCGVSLDVRGAPANEIASWLWDFDARPLGYTEQLDAPANTEREARTGFSGKLYKTDAFLDAHPFGTIPAAFSPDGVTGIFESNSIMRAVARLGEGSYPLYGSSAYEAARVDSFLDASLVFAVDSQRYLLSLRGRKLTPAVHASATAALQTYLGGIDRAMAPARDFIVGNGVTLADICFVAELALFSRERSYAAYVAEIGLGLSFHNDLAREYPRALALYSKLCEHPAFAPDVEPYLRELEASADG